MTIHPPSCLRLHFCAAFWLILEGCLFLVVSFEVWIFDKLKLWEVMLLVAICLLAALIYETHNAPGRYVYTGLKFVTGMEFSEIYLDTATGMQWYLKKDSTGKQVWIKWNGSIPNRSHSIDR